MPAVTLCCVTVDHSAPEPLYLQLAAILRDKITSGQLAPRAALPSLRDLADEHDLAVTTVQKALGALKDEGLVVTYPGRGTFVAGG